jgi:hypothetical protein
VPSPRAEDAGGVIQLKGIVSFSTNQLALLEVPATQAWQREIILAQGQRQGNVEVLEIDPPAGIVKIRNAAQVTQLGFAPDAFLQRLVRPSTSGREIDSQAPAFLRLQQAGPRHVFALYQLLAHRSLIRPSSLPNFQLDLNLEEPGGTTGLVKAIEQALAEKGLVLRPERDKFVIAARKGDSTRVTPQLWELAVTLGGNAGRASAGTPETLLPPGVIDFPATDLNQVLMIYQELAGRTLLRPASLPASVLVFQTYTPLTRTEAIYGFNAMLAVNGISVLPAGEKFFLAFPASATSEAAALVTRKTPVRAVSDEKSVPAGTINFPGTRLREVMKTYGELCGQPVEMDAGLPDYPFVLRNQTSLTATEALYALDLLLGWQGLTVVEQQDGKGPKLVRTEEGKR